MQTGLRDEQGLATRGVHGASGRLWPLQRISGELANQTAEALVMCVQAEREEPWEEQPGGARQRQECLKPEGIRQVLCSRTDTTVMCRFYDAQSKGASLGMPVLGSGVTIFVMVDAAISRLKYMTRDSGLGE